jgi:hypothetical protein
MKDVAALQAAKISAMYAQQKEKKKAYKKEASGPQVGKLHDMRKRILQMSLFPNVFNKGLVYSEEL